MTQIIVVGYPKSGNTWVTRLVAELVECPVVGFWNSDHKEIAQEGLNRKSEFQCFKSHHQLHELSDCCSPGEKRIIYIIRDPRDLAVSGAHYFSMDRWPFLARFFSRLPKGKRIYRRFVNPQVTSISFRIEQMVRAVLFGLEDVHMWVRIPWKTHYKPYLENGFFFVKYEDLLADPEHECKRILEFLQLQRTNDQILRAIDRQSFDKKKESFQSNNELGKVKFMHSGKSGRWKLELSEKQKEMFNEILSDELALFSYPVEENR